MENPDFTIEPLIGHHVAARRKPKTKLGRELDRIAENLNIPRRDWEYVEIEVGDVDWDSTKTIQLQKGTLLEIADYYRE